MNRLLSLLLSGAAGAAPLAAAALWLGAASPAQAQQAQRPQALGTFQDWTAATHQEGKQKVCYAFARAENRQAAILTVTHRPQGRDQVALRAGHSYPRNAEVTVTVGSTELDFYTAQDNAFAREGAKAVAAFRAGAQAVAKGPGAQGRGTTSDTFSLSGFTAAYEAISKECPAGRR
ncbi:invasion associated locus B family protein [Teichococcus aestuarii]|uniref:invasion associated locus B family protein n=1 Tax=Teichococcus aestuarii TaxID=568898 RepID=UPI0036242170